jgi:hypothetical protein
MDIVALSRSILETTPVRWQNLAQTLPTDLLTRKPTPTEWSALECLQHLLDTEAIFPFRIQCLLDGKDFPGFNPDKEGSQGRPATPVDLTASFTQKRIESLRMLDKVTPADFTRTARHQELGIVTMAELIHEWAAHDLNHTIQAERAVMQPFIEGCGPWQAYFSDHVIPKG